MAKFTPAEISSIAYSANSVGIRKFELQGVTISSSRHDTGCDCNVYFSGERVLSWDTWFSPAYEFNNKNKGWATSAPTVQSLVCQAAEALRDATIATRQAQIEAEENRKAEADQKSIERDLRLEAAAKRGC